MLVFNKYFYKNEKSKLYFGDRVAVLNNFIYQTGGSMLHPDSVCFLILQVNTRERYREGGNISLKKSLLLEEKGKAKGSPSVTKKLQQAFRRLVHPDARRFWATFPGHGCEQGVCHKNSSRSCVRGMSNPIIPYHKNSSSN
jgi:hypothetical protein